MPITSVIIIIIGVIFSIFIFGSCIAKKFNC